MRKDKFKDYKKDYFRMKWQKYKRKPNYTFNYCNRRYFYAHSIFYNKTVVVRRRKSLTRTILKQLDSKINTDNEFLSHKKDLFEERWYKYD